MAVRGRQAVITHRLRCLSGVSPAAVTATSTAAVAVERGQQRGGHPTHREGGGTSGSTRKLLCRSATGRGNNTTGSPVANVGSFPSAADSSRRPARLTAPPPPPPHPQLSLSCINVTTRGTYGTATSTKGPRTSVCSAEGGSITSVDTRGGKNRRVGERRAASSLNVAATYSAGIYTTNNVGGYPVTSTASRNYPATVGNCPASSGSYTACIRAARVCPSGRRGRDGERDKRDSRKLSGGGSRGGRTRGKTEAPALSWANVVRRGGLASRGGKGWRGFASASSPPDPEQYLRYIHRVKPPEAAEKDVERGRAAERRKQSTTGSLSVSEDPHNLSGESSLPHPTGASYRRSPDAVKGGGGGDNGVDSAMTRGDEVPGSIRSNSINSRSSSAKEGLGQGRGREDLDDNEDDREKDDAHTREMTRKWLQGFSAEDILRDKTLLRQQLEVRGNCTVDEAVTAFVNERVTSFVVVNRRKEVIGMFTSRDLLTELAKFPDKADGLKSKAHEFMIPLARMIYCSPKDSLYQCLLVMSELKIFSVVGARIGTRSEAFRQPQSSAKASQAFQKVRNLPVVSEGKVMGIVNVNDVSDFSFSMEELGGKKAYMKNISERKGLPKGVGLDPRQNRSGWKQAFSASVGAVALPHPHKMPNGNLSANTREHRHLEVAEDASLSEDAHFMLDMAWATPTTDTVQYVGLADGVGSWRKVGVDPREFSHRLMHWASQYILSMAPGSGIGAHLAPPPPKPHQVLGAAWEYTIGEKVVGSSTAIVAALDYDLEQLTFSNIGDCGVVVLRHIDSDVAGYMREKKTPRYLRDNDLRLAFISQQQLRSFNLPYQFGYTNVPEDNANFETPRDAVNTSFPVRPGDIIVLATDGLYDNMELDDICAVALNWEYKWFGGPMERLSEHNNAAMEDLAQQLGQRARELSLDNSRDSPFALLAKENDIMWGGGMPDDITIVALRVINKAQSSAAAVSKRGVGPDDQHVDEAA